MTVQELKKDLAEFTKRGTEIVHAESDEYEAAKKLQSAWKDVFHTSLDATSAKGFVTHFKGKSSKASPKASRAPKVTRRRRKQHGGMAPLAYQMGPGVPSALTHGHFTTNVATDSRSQHDLDVYFNSGMSRTAGTETWRFPTVPAGMGSNQVGGRRTRRQRRLRQKGGASLLESIGQIVNQATVPPSLAQTAYGAYSGQAPAASSDPTVPAWSHSNTSRAIDPSSVTRIGSDINQLVSPAPWK
jgi:hypothetical protein